MQGSNPTFDDVLQVFPPFLTQLSCQIKGGKSPKAGCRHLESRKDATACSIMSSNQIRFTNLASKSQSVCLSSARLKPFIQSTSNSGAARRRTHIWCNLDSATRWINPRYAQLFEHQGSGLLVSGTALIRDVRHLKNLICALHKYESCCKGTICHVQMFTEGSISNLY